MSVQIIDISGAMFGGISINQYGEDGFDSAADYLELGHIRWPGGALAEVGGIDPNTGAIHTIGLPGEDPYYALNPDTHPELVHPLAIANNRASLSDMLANAIETGRSLSINLPSQRYADDPVSAYLDTKAFLERLYVDGAFNNGVVPDGLIFDVGSEHYEPQEYGPVAIGMILALSEFRAAIPDAQFEIALQAMQSGAETSELVALIENSPYPHVLGEVDIIRHHVLDLSLDQVAHIEDFSVRYWAIYHLQNAVDAANGGDPAPDLYFSAWTTDSDDAIPKIDQGLPAGAAMLSLFAGMVEMGADLSAAWGIGAQANNPARLSMQEAGENV